MAEPYIPFYPADYLADTMHLTLEEHGAYLKLLMVLWRAGGRLPDDDKKLCQILGVTPKRWAALKEGLRPFFTYDQGQFCQKRLLAERELAEEKSEKRALSGSAGGKAKALKKRKSPVANAAGLPEQTSGTHARLPDQTMSSDTKVSSEGDALPIWVDPELWQAFRDMRKALRAPLTAKAEQLAIRKLEKLRLAGHDPTGVLEQSIRNSWKDLYELKGFTNGRQPESKTQLQRAIEATERARAAREQRSPDPA